MVAGQGIKRCRGVKAGARRWPCCPCPMRDASAPTMTIGRRGVSVMGTLRSQPRTMGFPAQPPRRRYPVIKTYVSMVDTEGGGGGGWGG